MASKALHVIAKQVAKLREEESSDEAWFILPPAEDEEVNWQKFSVELEGPKEYNPSPNEDGSERPSPYADGLFRVLLTFPDAFPAVEPDVQFQTKVWHPLVHETSGKLCHDYIKSQWKPGQHGVRDAMVMLRTMLAQPHLNVDMAVNIQAKEQLKDLASFDAHAKRDTEAYAKS